mgnify:CR=1 FL=1
MQTVSFAGRSAGMNQPAFSAKQAASGPPARSKNMQFGILDGGCVSVPCAVAGCALVPIGIFAFVALGLKKAISTIFGGIKNAGSAMTGIFKNAAA